MPLVLAALFTFLGSLLVGLFEFAAKYFSKRLLIVGIAITVLIAITVAFFAVIESLLTSILVTMPTEVSQYIGLFLPSNFTACMTALITAKLARWAYDWQAQLLKIKIT